jgi:phospholipid transport system substrate-binding protein
MITRRKFLTAILVASAAPALADTEHPSVVYMKQVGKDLLNAHRQGTVSAFLRVVQRYADIQGIAEYSLGDYQNDISPGQRERYYRGVATFISRYFADQSREYRIAKYELGEARVSGDNDIQIPSTVYLMTGQQYTVNWRVGWRNGRYRVTDAKMLGFSMTYMQRNLFTSFIAKKNGDVSQLVAALNR